MERSVSLVSQAKDFIRDLVIKMNLPVDGELKWKLIRFQREDRVEVDFSIRLSEQRQGDRLFIFKAICYFCPSGLCMVQVFGTKEGRIYHVTALFRDEEGSRKYEIHEPRGHTRQGFYPIAAITP